MNRKPHGSTVPSSPDALSSSSTPSASSKKPAAPKKAKISTRTVGNLTGEQLERKRANDREAQKAIRERTKTKIATLETDLEKSTEKLRQAERENDDLKGELAWYQNAHGPPGFASGHDPRRMSIDPRQPSVVASETGIPWPAQQELRRPSRTEHMDLRSPAVHSPASAISASSTSTFPEPPNQYRNPRHFSRAPTVAQPPSPLEQASTQYGVREGMQAASLGYPIRSTQTLEHQHMQCAPALPVKPESPASQHAVAHYEGWAGPREGQRGAGEPPSHPSQFGYPQVARAPPEPAYSQQMPQTDQYSQYHGQSGYAMRPIQAPQQYTTTAPQYGPVDTYPQQMQSASPHNPSYAPGSSVPQRPPYGGQYYHTYPSQPPPPS